MNRPQGRSSGFLSILLMKKALKTIKILASRGVYGRHRLDMSGKRILIIPIIALLLIPVMLASCGEKITPEETAKKTVTAFLNMWIQGKRSEAIELYMGGPHAVYKSFYESLSILNDKSTYKIFEVISKDHYEWGPVIEVNILGIEEQVERRFSLLCTQDGKRVQLAGGYVTPEWDAENITRRFLETCKRANVKEAGEKYCAIEISGENEDDIDIPWSFLYTISVKKTFVYEIVKVSDCQLVPDVPNGEEKTGYCIDVHLWIGSAEQRDEEADLMFYYDPNILRNSYMVGCAGLV